MEKKRIGVKSAIFPEPVLVLSTYNEDGTPDAMVAAWGFILDTGKIGVVLSADHKTTKNILRTKATVLSLATSSYVDAIDYLGNVSANDNPNKYKKSGLCFEKAPDIDAPLIKELPLSYECEYLEYDENKELMVLKIKEILADPLILNEKGKLYLDKISPVSYDGFNHVYRGIGKEIGQAFKNNDSNFPK